MTSDDRSRTVWPWQGPAWPARRWWSMITVGWLAAQAATAQPLSEVLYYDERGNLALHSIALRTTDFRYDGLDRLRWEGSLGAQLFWLDADGNRLADSRSQYRVTPGGQRLAERDGVALVHGPAGHLLVDYAWLGGRWVQRGFDWTLAGQLGSVRVNGVPVASYHYNEARQRTRKTLAAPPGGVPAVTLYRHDPEGRLVMEVAGSAAQASGISVVPGQVLVRYVWQDAVPVAVVWPPMTPGNPNAATDRIVYLQADHLNTPRRATDARGVVVWKWHSDAFGASPPDEDVDRDGLRTTINLRLPGQYFDAESGLHYNWNRYYDPQVGRYTQSDPIGLAGGINTYVYAEGRPTSLTDPLGLTTYLCSQPLHALGKVGEWVFAPKSNLLHHKFIGVLRPDGSSVTGGLDRAGGLWSDGKPSDRDGATGSHQCEKVEDDNECLEQCLLPKMLATKRPKYALIPGTVNGGENCQSWAEQTIVECRSHCKARQ